MSFRKATEDFQRTYLLEALNRFEWNKSITARHIGVERKTVERLIKKFKLEEPAPEEVPQPPKRTYRRRRLTLTRE